jgi:tetratricopeptide (TPR) repeat protein
MNDLQELLNYFVVNPEEIDINFKLGNYYNSIGQTASAVSYYIRTSERTNDKEKAYSCLLAAANCFDSQGCRSNSVKGMLQNAISLLPSRPEAYFLLSRFYERQSNYQDSYLIASIGESVSNRECGPLDINVGYPGFYGIIFEKAVSAWHCGLCDESCNLHYDLLEKYEMDSIHTGAVTHNIEKLFVGRREVVKSVKTVEEDNRLSYESKPTVWVVDNFYEEPDSMREFALNQNYDIGGIGRGYIGNRTHEQFLFPELKSKFENIMGKKITKWEEYWMNGRFQYCWSGQPVVYHCDSQMWGGMIYLTPDAPFQCGTTLYANKDNKVRRGCEPGGRIAWDGKEGDPFLDGTPFEPVDVLGNVYNRLVIFDAQCIHSASEYFGTLKENCRLWQMFFFDTE